MDLNTTARISSSTAAAPAAVKTDAAAKAQATEQTEAAAKQETAASARQDSYVKSGEDAAAKTGIYSKESISKTIEQMEEQRSAAFLSMIQKMFETQGQAASFVPQSLNQATQLKFSPSDIRAAKDSISDGGEFSIDAVATRIMDMAKALAGDDPSKIDALRKAVTKGFGQAAKTLKLDADKMPDITKQTYSEIMKRFDDWEKSYEKADDATTTATVEA